MKLSPPEKNLEGNPALSLADPVAFSVRMYAYKFRFAEAWYVCGIDLAETSCKVSKNCASVSMQPRWSLEKYSDTVLHVGMGSDPKFRSMRL